MINLSYYRIYIILYIYALTFLLLVAFLWDMIAWGVESGAGAGGGGGFVGKTITGMMVFICSYGSLALRHRALEQMVRLDSLQLNKYLWIADFLIFNKKKQQMEARSSKKMNLLFIHLGIMLLLMLPLLIGEASEAIPSVKVYSSHFYCREIAITGIIMRGALWFPTLLVAKFSVFKDKKRYLELS